MIMSMESNPTQGDTPMSLMTACVNRLFPNRNVKTRIKWLVTLSY